MKTNWALRIASGAAIALASVHSWTLADASEASAASNGAAIAASGSTTAKDVRKADRALRRKVYSAIVTHREINAGDISVIAKGGAVTLDGTVIDASQIDKVSEIATGVAGVTSVANKLTVKKPFGGQ